MCEFIGTWGSCWCPDTSIAECVHPDDIQSFREDWPNNGVMLTCVAGNGEYLTLRCGDSTYRVRPDRYRKLQKPSREYGDEVTIKTKGKVTKAQIAKIVWHSNRGEPYYYVSVDGKLLKRQYFDEDLIE